MNEKLWYYYKDEIQTGPVPEGTLKGLIHSGQIPPDTYVWTEPMKDWDAASNLAAFGNRPAAPVPVPQPIPVSSVDPGMAFGGWLKFFYAIIWLRIVLAGVGSLCILMFFTELNSKGLREYLLVGAYCLAVAYLSYQISRIIKNANSGTPNEIVSLMTQTLAVTGAYVILDLVLIFTANNPEWKGTALTTVRDASQECVWYFIWTSYFRKSKRVGGYYGANAS